MIKYKAWLRFKNQMSQQAEHEEIKMKNYW